MKHIFAKRFLFIALAGFAVCSAPAQITFVKGYVVNEKGDTLKGEVKYNPKKEQDCYNKVYFKDATGAIKNYKPKKSKAYGFNERHFAAMDFEGEMKYYQVLAIGEINMYKIMYEMISMNQPILGAEYFISHKKDPANLTSVKQGKFKKQMTDWMKDHPDFINDFDDDKDFDSDTAIEVIKKYNAWKEGK